MKSSSRKTSAKNPADEYNQLVDELQDMTQPTHSTKGEDEGCDITSLKSRAQQLMVWITRHKNHVDRHELADICKEGMKTIMKIMKASRKMDTTELELELMVLEARKTVCEEAFAEDLKGFDNITSDILSSLTPDFQASIKSRIAKAKINIYKSEDTPTGILEIIEQIHKEDRESRIDSIISETLDADSNFTLLRKSQILRDELRVYIREHQKYTGYKALVEQVKIVLNNYNIAINANGYYLPRDISRFIKQYNYMIDYLYTHRCLDDYSTTKIDINVFFPEHWSLYDFSNFSYYSEEYNQVRSIFDEFQSNLGNLYLKADGIRSRKRGYPKPSHISDWDWEYYNDLLDKILQELYSNKLEMSDDRYLSYYNKIVDDLISKIS